MDPLLQALRTSLGAVLLSRESDSVVVAGNRAAAELCGYEAAELGGMRASDLLDGVPPLSKGAGAAAHESGVSIRRRGGDRVPAKVIVLAVTGESGERLLWTSVQSPAVLPEDEEKFRALSEAGFEALFIHDNGTILMANEAMDRIFHAPSGSLIGRSMFDFIAPQSRDDVAAHVMAAAKEPYEGLSQRADGSTFPVEVHGRAVTFNGRSARLVAIRDLTDRKRLETSLVRADRLAALGTVAAGVAHEINNPLAYILLNLELVRSSLERGTSVSEAARQKAIAAVTIAVDGAMRVKRIVGELRGLARDTGDESGSSDLGKVVAFAAALVKHQLHDRAALEVSVDVVPRVLGSNTRLGQVLLNLLVNAAQAIPRGARERHRVTVRVRRDGEAQVLLEVADTGEGIPPELLPHVFEPFVTTKAQGEGTGLGLSIARGIVAGLGGSMELESVVGEGTTFRVRLPVAPSLHPPAGAPGEGRVPTDPSRAPIRVLVVDDERAVRAVIAQALGDVFDVVPVGSGAEVLTLLEKGEAFDVMLCDLMMPEMTGMELHALVAKKWPALARRTAVLSGGAFSERARHFIETSGLVCLDKPFSIGELIDAVSRVAAS